MPLGNNNFINNGMNACYYCGKEATTKEHVPPKQMFKGFKCDSITVPSCIDHNCSKGGADQAVVSAFLTSIRNYSKTNKRYKFRMGTDLARAIKMAHPSFERTKNRVISKPFLDYAPNELKHLPDIGFLKAPIKISIWIRGNRSGTILHII